MSLSQQPTELLDQIAFWIAQPKDLLSLALTSRRFYEIIVPYHVEYRHLQTVVAGSTLWEHLLARPDLIKRIRTLEIGFYDVLTGTVSYTVPKSVLNQAGDSWPSSNIAFPSENLRNERNVSLFTSSLEKMILLDTFKWRALGPAKDYQIMSVLLALEKLSCLQELQVNLKGVYMHLSELNTWDQPISFRAPHLSRVQFQTIPGQLIDKFTDVLLVCSELRDLHLSVTTQEKAMGQQHTSLRRLFKEAAWNNLQRLHVEGYFHVNEHESDGDAVIQPRTSILADFWVRHPMLECLTFYQRCTRSDPSIHRLSIPEGALPKLRSLGAMHGATVDIHEIGEHVAKLEYLQITVPMNVEDPPEMRASVLALLRRAQSLKSLVLGHWPSDQLKRIVDVVPYLEKLKIIILGTRLDKLVSLPVFSSMPYLTHLGGVLVTNEPPMQGFPTYMLKELECLDRLKYVDLYRQRYRQMERFKLIRNNEGELEEARMIVDSSENNYEFDYNKWGDLYTSDDIVTV